MRRQIRVAIIDDDASVRRSIGRLCQVNGLVVSTYGSAREFLESFDDSLQPADCLVLDAHMPEMNALELLRHLAALGVSIPAIVFSADDTFDIARSDGDASGGGLVTSFLKKPLSANDLFAAIELAVSSRKGPL